MRRHVIALVAICSLAACETEVFGPPPAPDAATAIVSAHTRGYVMVELGSLGEEGSVARYINDAGQVTGVSNTGTEAHVFFWEDGVMTDVGTLGGTDSQLPSTLPSRALSDAGHVIGLSTTAGDAATHSFLWHEGVMADLGPVQARAVNALGQVAGTTGLPGTSQLAFLWHNGTMTDLGTLGGSVAAAYSINNHGQVVGNSAPPGNTGLHVFRWEDGSMSGIGTLTPGAVFDIPYQINDEGYIIGRAHVSATVQQGFRWFNGSMIDLGNLGGSGTPSNPRLSQPFSVNASGEVVGSSLAPGNVTHAFLWRNGTMSDLGTLGGIASSASEINDAGQIAGQAHDATGVQHAVLWEGGDIIDLGRGFANSINADGWIAGATAGANGTLRAVIWRPASSDELIDLLRADVTSLLTAGTLSSGEANSLSSKLDAAAQALDRGGAKTALSLLQAFLNQLRALVESGRLTPAQAQPLIDRVEQVIDSLPG